MAEELNRIFDSLPEPEIDAGIVSLGEILAQHPYLTIHTPQTYFLYLSMNKDKLKDEDVQLVHGILDKLKRNEQNIVKKNLEKLEDRAECEAKEGFHGILLRGQSPL